MADLCLAERFDKIFYTGSPNVAKHVMAEESKNLTPLALELGGETGNWGFREFTHPQTVLKGRTFWNLSLREHPYTRKAEKIKMNLLKRFER